MSVSNDDLYDNWMSLSQLEKLFGLEFRKIADKSGGRIEKKQKLLFKEPSDLYGYKEHMGNVLTFNFSNGIMEETKQGGSYSMVFKVVKNIPVINLKEVYNV